MGWGDELMVTGHVREMQRKDPRKVRVVYERPRWHEAWENNPRIALVEEKGDFQVYEPRQGYLRPYMTEKTESRWHWKPYRPPRGELYFSAEEKRFGEKHAGQIIIEPRIKPGASPNKDWGQARWKELVRLATERGLKLAQVGPHGKYRLPGVSLIVTSTMRLAAAVLAQARAAVLPEGGLHHVCAAVGTSAVVIFGGFISPEVTGYEEQTSLYERDEKYRYGLRPARAVHALRCGDGGDHAGHRPAEAGGDA
jgi:hypothetical protein